MERMFNVTENQIFDIVKECVDIIDEGMLLEMAMKPDKMADKYGEIIGVVVDNMVCVCMYPDNRTVNHWRSRIAALLKRFVELNIDPISKNNPKFRKKTLMKGVVETLDKDYAAIENHFKSIAGYYAAKSGKDKMVPAEPYERCYNKNKNKIISAVLVLTEYVAEQDMEGLTEFVETF